MSTNKTLFYAFLLKMAQHHLRLYIYSFSLQAHMQRVQSTHDGSRPLDYFPGGLMGCVDARFIVEAINAAVR